LFAHSSGLIASDSFTDSVSLTASDTAAGSPLLSPVDSLTGSLPPSRPSEDSGTPIVPELLHTSVSERDLSLPAISHSVSEETDSAAESNHEPSVEVAKATESCLHVETREFQYSQKFDSILFPNSVHFDASSSLSDSNGFDLTAFHQTKTFLESAGMIRSPAFDKSGQFRDSKLFVPTCRFSISRSTRSTVSTPRFPSSFRFQVSLIFTRTDNLVPSATCTAISNSNLSSILNSVSSISSAISASSSTQSRRATISQISFIPRATTVLTVNLQAPPTISTFSIVQYSPFEPSSKIYQSSFVAADSSSPTSIGTMGTILLSIIGVLAALSLIILICFLILRRKFDPEQGNFSDTETEAEEEVFSSTDSEFLTIDEFGYSTSMNQFDVELSVSDVFGLNSEERRIFGSLALHGGLI
jgi:hypothetical protein